MSFDFESLKVQGVKVNYYFICKRKLWLFSNGIAMEDTSDRVTLGRLIHENSYKRKENKKEKLIDNMIKVDIIDNKTVNEVKITSKMQDIDRYQIIYYLYYLKQLGIEREGTLNYVKEKKIERIKLTKEDEFFIEDTLIKINEILSLEIPPKVEKYPYCKKCSYYPFCYVREEK